MYPYISLGLFVLPTYYLVISLSVIVAALWFLRRARERELLYVRAIDFALLTMASGFLGARLLHVAYEEPAFYHENPAWILEFWHGGFVYLGGLFGATVGAWGFCIWRREPFLLWADLVSIPASFAYATGRIACFLNGCCYGRACSLPWAVFMNGAYRHPVQLYASAMEFLTLGILLLSERRIKNVGVLFGLWLTLTGLSRVVMEVFRADPRGQYIDGFSLGSWMGLITAICGLMLIIFRSTSGSHVAID